MTNVYQRPQRPLEAVTERKERPVLPAGALRRAGRLAMLPLRHAGRTAAAASRLSWAAGDQVAARTAEQLFATLGELKGGAAKLGQAMSVFEAAMPEEVAAPYRSALRRLTDAAPAMPADAARRVVAADLAVVYGPGWRERLVAFDDTPAAAAGLKPGDVITGYNGIHIYHPIALADFIESHANQPITLQVVRAGKSFEATVTPKILPGEKTPRIGIQWDATGRLSLAHPNPIEQIYNSVTSTLNTIGAVASPKSDVKLQHLSGPVGIGRIYYMLFQNERGWQLALWFSVILNVNLAILNMLPIPVLDGGHIVLALIESVRRKPVNMRLLEIVQTSCAVLIIGYMLYVTFFDVQDLPFVKSKLDQLETQAPQPKAGQEP